MVKEEKQRDGACVRVRERDERQRENDHDHEIAGDNYSLSVR